MTRARELANFADDTAGLETLTVSDVTDLSVSASNINSATNQITDSSTDLNVDSNTLVVDKSENKVGIGTASPDELLHLKSSTSLNPILKIENTNADHLNAQINFIKNSASEADDDYLGQIDFEGLNDNDEMIVYGRLQSQAKDVSDGTEDGRVYISAMVNGTLDQTFNVVSGDVGIGVTSPTAKLHISGVGTGGNASFHNYNTSSATFIHNQWNLASNMTANQTNVIFVGKEPNTKNSGWIGYKWVGNASNSNTLSFGHWGNDHLMNLTADGKFGIGTTSPESGIQVTGGNNITSSITLRNTNPNPDSHWQITPLYDSDVLAFRSANNSHANRMTISAGGDVTIPSGNVGIGYASPPQMLSIKQTVNDAYTPTAFNDKSLITLHVPNAEDNYGGIRFTHAGNTEGFFGYHRESSTSSRAEFVWQGYDGNANSYREYMRLNWQGKLGIGGDPTGALLTGKSSGSDNAEVYLGATGTGNAGVVFDGSNGDFAGSDYYMLRQMNSLDVENWLGTSGDYIWKTNAGGEKLRLTNNGTLKHVSGNTQLAYEQYSYGTSSFASNGNWHTMLSGLSGHHVLLVRMYQSGSGFHTSALFIAANTYASGNIWTFSSGGGWSSNVELRWTGSTYNYNLEGRSTGTNSALTYWRIKNINI